MIKWQEAYSTGIAKLDNQHKNLFQYSNDLEDGINNGQISRNVVDLALKFLERYIKGHFSSEESCMYQYACPMADTNKLAHQEFINTYKKFQKKVLNNDDHESALRELHQFLQSWLTRHICNIDTKLKTCAH